MARATFVKKARKDVAGTDIKAGEPYYWWKFRRGGKHFSKAPPKRSQLTQSAFYSQVWDIEDRIAEAGAREDLESIVEEVAQDLRSIGEECQSSFDNMPEGLQQGDTGQLLEERVQAMESAADEFENIDFGDKPDEPVVPEELGEDATDEDREAHDEAVEAHKEAVQELEDYWQGKLDEVQGVSIDAP